MSAPFIRKQELIGKRELRPPKMCVDEFAGDGLDCWRNSVKNRWSVGRFFTPATILRWSISLLLPPAASSLQSPCLGAFPGNLSNISAGRLPVWPSGNGLTGSTEAEFADTVTLLHL